MLLRIALRCSDTSRLRVQQYEVDLVMICPGRRAPLDVLTQQLEPFQAQRPHAKPTKQASGLGSELGLRVGVVAAVNRSRKQSHRRAKIPQSRDKTLPH